jgi:hypothetical protein
VGADGIGKEGIMIIWSLPQPCNHRTYSHRHCSFVIISSSSSSCHSLIVALSTSVVSSLFHHLIIIAHVQHFDAFVLATRVAALS